MIHVSTANWKKGVKKYQEERLMEAFFCSK